MHMKNIKTPGEVIGTEEEFVAKEGTYSDKGVIYSAALGEYVEDRKQVGVKAKGFRDAREGDVLMGRVEQIFDQFALVDLEGGEGIIKPPSYASLHVSSINSEYVESIRNEIRIGDIVKVKVSEIKRSGSVSVTMKEPPLGIVKAFCSKCRKALPKDLVCSNCGSKERRKLAR